MVKKSEIEKFEEMLKKIKIDKKTIKKAKERPTERSIDHFGLKRVDDNYETDSVYVINEDEDGNIITEFRNITKED